MVFEHLRFRTEAERAQVVDMSLRLRPVTRTAVGVLLVAAVLAAPVFGWAPVAAASTAALVFAIVQTRLRHYRRPELAMLGTWALAVAMGVVLIVFADGPRAMLFPIFAFPMMLASVVWPTRFVVGGAAVSAATLIITAVFTEGALIASVPHVLAVPVALVVSTALISSISRDVEVASRSSAATDELTGTLNRGALEARVAELAHQSSVNGQRVAVLLADIDHFKAINDDHGHQAGDLVLGEFAQRVRDALPPFTALYRYGGEEFVALIPNAAPDAALAIAEDVREAVRARPLAGHEVTVSIGVAVSDPGRRFDFTETFTEADAALYRAKADGRDRVRAADARTVALGPAAAAPSRGATPAVPAAAVPVAAVPARRERSDEGSWLVDPLERRHLLDLAHRLRNVNHIPYVIALMAVLTLIPTHGWFPLWPPIVAALIYRATERALPRVNRPEYWLGGAWLVAQIINAIAFVGTTQNPEYGVYVLPMLCLMLIGSSSVFPRRGVMIGTVFVSGLIIALALAGPLAVGVTSIVSVAYLVALVITFGLIGSAVGSSAVHHREAAIVDRLTGLLNRRAMEARTIELAHAVRESGGRLSVIIGDIDHFKQINDRNGHAVGDRVLAGVADRLRGSLRAFEGIYRFGGEEFAILLAGTDAADAERTAERLRTAISERPIHGLPVTMSFGVTSGADDFKVLFARADTALYRAKAEGRDRVCSEPPLTMPAAGPPLAAVA